MSVLVLHSERKNQLDGRFTEIFGAAPERYFSAPGRTEISGNHTVHLSADDQPREDPVATTLEAVRAQLAGLQLQQENICEYLEKGVYTIDIFTKRNSALTKEIKQLQISEAELLRQQAEDSQKNQSISQIVPVTQQILESYSILTPLEKNQLWKLVMKKATVYRSQDDELTVRVYPNVPK